MTVERKPAVLQLAEWVVDLSASDIPLSVRRCIRRCVIDTVGVAIAGSSTRVAQLAYRVASDGGSNQFHAKAFGVPGRFAAKTAAFVNGAAAHALDFDDNCYAGFVHGSAVIVPAGFAVAQDLDASGADLITALVAGAECEYAIGAASKNVLYDQGWWTTGVLGPIGACAAVCRLLKLTVDQTASALGLAIVGAGGMKACFGSDGKALMAGRASESGVVCALLAAEGARGPQNAIEGPNGFISLFNGGEFDHSFLDALGSAWFLRVPGIDIKRIPVCLSSHAAADAVLELVATHAIALHDIDRIICDVPPIVCKNLAYDRPMSVQQAQFSLPYAIATLLHFGEFGLQHLDLALIQSDLLLGLMSRVSMHTGPMWNEPGLRTTAPEGASVAIHLRDGQVFKAFKASAVGCASDPLTEAQLEGKFLACTKPVMGDGPAHDLLTRLGKIDSDISTRSLL